MKPLSLDRNSIISSALWFGASAAIQAVLIVGFWSVIVPSTAYVPALFWGFLSGAIVGVLIWHVPVAHTLTFQSYSAAALRGGVIGPLSLLTALLSDTLFEYLAGNLKDIEDLSQITGEIVFAVVHSLGVPIVFISTMSGIGYAFVHRKACLRHKC